MEMEMEAMAGDEAIVKRMGEILESADLSVITTKHIRMQLEKDLGIDMSDRKVFIREQVELFMSTRGQAEEPVAENGENGNVEVGSGSESEEEPDSKRLRAKIKRAMKESLPKTTTNKRKRGASGFQKVCQLSPELAAVIGESQAPRTQVVKILWQYIRDHKLQLPKDRRKIRCDEALKKVFNVDQVDMFKMQKKLSKHLFPLDEASYLNAPERSQVNDAKPEVGVEDVISEKGGRTAKRIKREQRRQEQGREDKKLGKKIEKRRTGFAAPVRISQELQEFLQVEESELSRQQVTKKMWEYIKSNNLQDPEDKRRILCDEKLHKLFNCEKFSGFGDMPKLLKVHYLGKPSEEAEEKAEEGSNEEEEQTEATGNKEEEDDDEVKQASVGNKEEEDDGEVKQDTEMADTEQGTSKTKAEQDQETETEHGTSSTKAEQDQEMADTKPGISKTENEDSQQVKREQDTEMAETEPEAEQEQLVRTSNTEVKTGVLETEETTEVGN